ncbi:MAG: hypothetical protein HZC42_10530 [Candidatus Eisenbacteria bacterium]|nr:hypothetical protein [Candidatus Eisenbacteria bacterium]
MSASPATPPAVRPRGLPLLVRDAEAGFLAELFLVCAVATILLTRAILAATGYPQLGGGRLHIAHMLWGGLALAVALVLILVSLSRRAKPVAAFVGGVGFGFFMDELGKFLTRDNDYFYQPAIALIYLVLVAFFLATRRLLSRTALSDDECLANAITLMKEMALQDLDATEKARAAAHLDRCDPADPRVALVRGFLDRLTPISPPPPAWTARLRRWLDARLERVTSHPRFPRVMSLVFVGQALFAVGWVLITARTLWQGWRDPVAGVHLGPGLAEWARLGSTVASTALVVAGVARLRRDPVRAYRSFRMSLLVAVFVTQFFVFYDAQLHGVIGLAFNLALLAAVQALLARARDRAARRAVTAVPHAAV